LNEHRVQSSGLLLLLRHKSEMMWTGFLRKSCITFFRLQIRSEECGESKMLWRHFAIRLGLALILGAFVGAERQWRQRMAGLRTNALVAAGAAMFVMLSALATRPDDSFRIAGQVVSGIGFLGAGVILAPVSCFVM
jgi:MgtC family